MDRSIEKKLEDLRQRLAELYDQGFYEKASKIAEEILDLTGKHLGENHPDHATALNDLAVLYTGMGKRVVAEKLHLKALHIRQISRGENHPDCAESLHNLAHLYDSSGNYAKARPLYTKAIEIFRNSLGENHPNCIESRQSLAELSESVAAATEKIKQLSRQAYQLSQRGEHDQALAVVKKECEMTALCHGEDSLNHAGSLNHLGTIHFSLHNYSQAEKALTEAVRIYESSKDKELAGYSTSLSNLASVYRSMGKLKPAEQLFRQLAELKAETPGENDPEYADALIHLAWLYHATGRNSQAEQLYRKVLGIRSARLGKQSKVYGRTLNDLAHLYMSEGRYVEAEPLYKEVEEIWRSSQGEDLSFYMIGLSNLEELYRSMGRLERADSLLRQRIDIQRNHLDLFSGEDNENDIYREKIANFQITPTERNTQYWPPLQVPLAQAAAAFYQAGYSEKHKPVNEELAELYARGRFAEAKSLLGREFADNRKTLDQEEIRTSISHRLKLDSTRIKQLDRMLLQNRNLGEFVSCPLLLEIFCDDIERGLLSPEELPLEKELDLYRSVVDRMLQGGLAYQDPQAIRRSGSREHNGIEKKVIAFEDLALAFFVNRQSVFTRTEIVNVLKHTAVDDDERTLEDIYQQTDLLWDLSTVDYAFYNRTLHEYLTARAMYRRISDHLQSDWVDELIKFWDPACFWQEHWINVIRMFLGLLPADKHPEFLRTCARNLPGDLGSLEESRLEKGQPLIVMINTPYTSTAINERIAKILGFFVETRAIRFVFTEGGDGPIDRSFYQDIEKFRDDTVKKQLARAYLEKMTISGQEYIAIISWQDFHLWGIDNEALWAKLLKQLKEIALETRDVIGTRKKKFVVYARAQSMSSTIRSVITEKDIPVSAFIIGSPYFLPFPNAYEVLSANRSNRDPRLLSYIKISPAGFDQLAADSDERYKEIMQGKDLYDVSI